LQGDQLPVQLASILVLGRGCVNDGPDLALAVVPANEHLHELDGVEAIGLGPAPAAVDLDAGRIDDAVLDAMSQEEAMEPEAVAPGFVAGDDPGVVREAEPLLGGLDLGQEALEVPRRD